MRSFVTRNHDSSFVILYRDGANMGNFDTLFLENWIEFFNQTFHFGRAISHLQSFSKINILCSTVIELLAVKKFWDPPFFSKTVIDIDFIFSAFCRSPRVLNIYWSSGRWGLNFFFYEFSKIIFFFRGSNGTAYIWSLANPILAKFGKVILLE